ncbi:MAG: DPP IV N-terminal domain-containing protein, partial [Flavobacteriales bacterium]|nr:DPP IV N-terminal domain-containing protein [Flavobacteriales bacterium]
MKRLLLLLLPFTMISAYGQTKELTLERAVMGFNSEDTTSLHPNRLSGIRWVSGSNAYAYSINRSKGLVVVNNGLNDTVKLQDVMTSSGLSLRHIPLKQWISTDAFIFVHKSIYYSYNRLTKKTEVLLTCKEGAQNRDYHLASNQCAITVNQNLYVASSTDKMGVVTHFSNKDFVAGQAIARYEFGISKGTFWSRDGKQLAFYQKDESEVHDYPLLDMTKTPGELRTIKYPMAGQKSELAKVGIYNASTKKTIYLNTTNSGLGEEHYLTNLTWDPTNQY